MAILRNIARNKVSSCVFSLIFILCAVFCGLMVTACKSGAAAATAAGTTANEIPEMVLIKGGTFTMGSLSEETNSFHDERPRHEVTLTNFNISKYEITQKEWKDVMGDNPSNFIGDNLPVEKVNWYDALVFCNKLSVKNGLTPAYSILGSTDTSDWGTIPVYPEINAAWDAVEIVNEANGYRLPTEAQWEYACRAGTTTPFNTGENITTDQANYNGHYPYKNNPEGIFLETTVEVGTFKPNAWGLYDMHGNVWEWCWDWHARYAEDTQKNPQGAIIGAYRVARGGSWNNNARFLRSAARGSSAPAFRESIIGLRIVRP